MEISGTLMAIIEAPFSIHVSHTMPLYAARNPNGPGLVLLSNNIHMQPQKCFSLYCRLNAVVLKPRAEK